VDLEAIWLVYLCGPMTHCVTSGSLTPKEGEIWGSNPEPKHAMANCSQTVSLALQHGEYERAIPPFAKLLWSLFAFLYAFLEGQTDRQTDGRTNGEDAY